MRLVNCEDLKQKVGGNKYYKHNRMVLKITIAHLVLNIDLGEIQRVSIQNPVSQVGFVQLLKAHLQSLRRLTKDKSFSGMVVFLARRALDPTQALSEIRSKLVSLLVNGHLTKRVLSLQEGKYNCTAILYRGNHPCAKEGK